MKLVVDNQACIDGIANIFNELGSGNSLLVMLIGENGMIMNFRKNYWQKQKLLLKVICPKMSFC